jgi:type VI secretion system protein ImpH
MLREYFGLPLELEQFRGRWLSLSVAEQSRIDSSSRRSNAFCQLGVSAWVGRRVWDVQSKFCVRIGPLRYSDFESFLPIGKAFEELGQLVRLYVGPEFDFDIQLVLLAGEVPRCRLASEKQHARRLGWNTWLSSRPIQRDADDAIFSGKGMPTRMNPY